MKLKTILRGVAVLAAVAMMAPLPARAAPAMPAPPQSVPADNLLVQVGGGKHHYHRRAGHRKFRHYNRRYYHGGISYVGPRGLRYAPRYHQRYGSGVSVHIHIGPRGRYYRQRARPFVYETRPVRRYQNLSASHYRWCDSRYRSYRYSDNTFQPYHGPRRHCRSPY